MTKAEFRQWIEKGPIFLDGATGSNLMKRGMPFGVCTEKWVLEHPEAIQSLQKEYIEAGSDIVYAPTFTGNRIKLKEYGLADQIGEINKGLVALSKEIAGEAKVAGDLTMTGESLAPIGTMTFEELVDVYEEQMGYLAEAKVDMFIIETMMSLQETRAALIAAKKYPDMPVMVTMTFEANGRTLYGTTPETAILVLQSLGADAVGVNCSAGPDTMVPIIKKMASLAQIPVIAKPNAGLPKSDENGNTYFDMDAKEFAGFASEMVDSGAHILGGCCGTAPEYIRALKGALEGKEVIFTKKEIPVKLSNERNAFDFEENMEMGIRIDLNENAELLEDLLDEDLDTLLDLLDEENDDEVDALQIACESLGKDGKEALLKVVEELSRNSLVPVIFKVNEAETLEAALRLFGGIAGVVAVNEQAKELAKKYGAVLVD